MITAVHRLGRAKFDLLATGAGGAPAVVALRSAQLSKHLLLIGRLLERWPGGRTERDTVLALLEKARTNDPGAFDAVLGAPLVGAWVSIANRALSADRIAWADFAHLSALAVVACAAAGVDADLRVPVRDGVVSLPGTGIVTVDTDVATARLVAVNGEITVHSGGAILRPTVLVRPLHGDHDGLRIRLELDDLDPYRHGHHAPPASRLTDAEVADWQGVFAWSWRLIAGTLPDRAAELSAGLQTLVPLIQTDPRTARSATIRHAFGVFGLTRPPTAADFAVTLIHEFQHSKLSALLDLTPLTDPADQRRFFAPWRADPRPIAGLMQGVYAFVGVADTWRALQADAEFGSHAQQQFAEARLQVDRGLTALEQSDALTPDGVIITEGLRQTTDALLAEPVPAAVALAAEERLERIRQRWLAQNNS